jgi:Rod binding domain-containing protein
MSKHLADSGGVGLAAALVRQMQATAPKPPSTTDAPALAPPARGYAPSAPRM